MNKRAQGDLLGKIVAIALILIVFACLLLFLAPMIMKSGVPTLNGLGDWVCNKLGDLVPGCPTNYIIPDSFKAEGWLDGTLNISFLLRDDGKIGYYEISQKEIGPATAFEVLKRGDRNDTSYLLETNNMTGITSLAGKDVPTEMPAGVVPKDFNLSVYDSEGNVLQSELMEYRGVFPGIYPGDKNRYIASIGSFIKLAGSLKSITGSSKSVLMLHNELMIIGFARDFNDGKGSYRTIGLLDVCNPGADIKQPEECSGARSCLCLCLNKDKCGDGGSLCYGYDSDFIGGSETNCAPSSWFGNKKGKPGEDSNPIGTYKGTKLIDPDHEFNSLAIENSNGGCFVANITQSSWPGTTLPSGWTGGQLQRIIISKTEDACGAR